MLLRIFLVMSHPSIDANFFYENTFLFESQENLYDSQYPNDYDICREEHIILDGSIFSLLKEIDRKATLRNNASNNPSPRRIEFRSHQRRHPAVFLEYVIGDGLYSMIILKKITY